MTEKEWDIFILHDSRDKSFTDPLYSRLKAKNLKVWYDKASLEIGDSLTEKIEEGIKNCDYGALIISKNLLNNDRTARKYELPSFKIRQIYENENIILPIWLDINEEELRKFSPWLADKVAIKFSDGMDIIIDNIFRKIQKIGKWIEADMMKGLKGYDQKGGVWYGVCRGLRFIDTDKGNVLKIDVKSEHKLRIELWNGIIKQNDEHWWDHHKKKVNSIGTDDEPKVALDQELVWIIEPGNYTLFFAGHNPTDKILPHKISYRIDIDKIPTDPTPAPIAPVPTPAPIWEIKKKVNILGSKVQDIGYRLFLYTEAENENIAKFEVNNLEEKEKVEVLLGDETDKIEKFIEFMKDNYPKNAIVDNINVDDYDGEILIRESFFRKLTASQLEKMAEVGIGLMHGLEKNNIGRLSLKFRLRISDRISRRTSAPYIDEFTGKLTDEEDVRIYEVCMKNIETYTVSDIKFKMHGEQFCFPHLDPLKEEKIYEINDNSSYIHKDQDWKIYIYIDDLSYTDVNGNRLCVKAAPAGLYEYIYPSEIINFAKPKICDENIKQ